MNRDRALELAEKLLALASSDNPGEAQAAVNGLKRVLASHNLSMFDVTERKLKEEVVAEHVDHTYWRVHQWVKVLATNMAIAFSCKVIFSHYQNPNLSTQPTRPQLRRYTFVGTKTDAEVASYFFDIFFQKLPDIAEKQGRAQGYSGAELLAYINTFIITAARKIKDRLLEYNEEQNLARMGKVAPAYVQEVFDDLAPDPVVDPDAESFDEEETDSESFSGEQYQEDFDDDAVDTEQPPAPKKQPPVYTMILRAKAAAIDDYIRSQFESVAEVKETPQQKEERARRAAEQQAAVTGCNDGEEAGHSVPIHQGLSTTAKPQPKPGQKLLAHQG